MGKINFCLVCREKDKVKDLEAFVYSDDTCIGKVHFFESFTFNVKADSAISVCINGSFSKEVVVPGNGDYDVVAEYAYYADTVCKMEIRDNKGDYVAPIKKQQHDKAYNSQSRDYIYTPESAETGIFGKLKKDGGWVHILFKVLFALMIIGVLISFIALLAEELPDIACIVLGSGFGVIVAFFLEYLLAGYFYFAARDKGYKDLMYLFFPWVFPVIGHLLIVALPDRGNGKNHENEQE